MQCVCKHGTLAIATLATQANKVITQVMTYPQCSVPHGQGGIERKQRIQLVKRGLALMIVRFTYHSLLIYFEPKKSRDEWQPELSLSNANKTFPTVPRVFLERRISVSCTAPSGCDFLSREDILAMRSH